MKLTANEFTLYKEKRCFSADNEYYLRNASEAPEVMSAAHLKGSHSYMSAHYASVIFPNHLG